LAGAATRRDTPSHRFALLLGGEGGLHSVMLSALPTPAKPASAADNRYF
jgi:hypothetical protein